MVSHIRRNLFWLNGLLLARALSAGPLTGASASAETVEPLWPDSLWAAAPDSIAGLGLVKNGPIIRSVHIRRDNVFSSDDPDAGRIYARLANALHWVTAERVVRRGLYFREGDTLRVADLEASLRRLRAYPFLHAGVRARVTGGEDSVDVYIRTRDTWSTRPEISFIQHGGLVSWSAALRERNLAGLGKDVQFDAGQTDRRRYWGIGYGDRQLLGSPLVLFMGISNGVDVDGADFTLQRPRDRADVRWSLLTEVHRYRGGWVDHRGGIDGPEYHADVRRLNLAAGPRVLRRGSRALWLMPAVHIDDTSFHPADDLEGWLGGDAGLGVNGPTERLRDRTRRLPGIELAYLDERFSLWSEVETLQHWEDVNLGSTARLVVGAALDEPGSGTNGAYWELEGEQGLRLGARRYAILSVNGYGLVAGGRTRDARVSAGLRYFDRITDRQTLALRLSGDRAQDLAPQDLPTMGAERGLRGFDAYRFWGERVLLTSLEDRFWLLRDFYGLISAGIAGFVDGGLAWNAGRHRSAVPRVSAGLGLRLQGSRTGRNVVTRIDVARPIAGGEPGDGWVITIASGQAF